MIGILIGIEREHWRSEKRVYAGVRTFAITSISGTVATIISEVVGIEILFITTFFVAMVCLLMIYSINVLHQGSGLTSGIALFSTYLLGILVAMEYFLFSIIVAIVITFLLIEKRHLHTFAENLTEKEILGGVQFLAVSFILYPILPHEPVFGVINLRSVIMIVLLVSTISFISYIFLKKFGPHGGMPYSGFFGGFVSSEATTGALSSLSRVKEGLVNSLFVGILLANLAMLLSNLIIAFIVDTSGRTTLMMLPPHLIMIAVSVYIIKKQRPTPTSLKGTIDLESPFALKPAFKFGLIFMVLMVAADIANQVAGPAGIYATALGGIISSSAVTASVASLAIQGHISYIAAAETAVTASIISTFSKILFVRSTGTIELFKSSKSTFMLIGATGVASLIIWGYLLRFSI